MEIRFVLNSFLKQLVRVQVVCEIYHRIHV